MIFRMMMAVALGAMIGGSDVPDAPATQPTVDEALVAQLAEIDRRAEEIADLTADFVQLKHTAMLKKPLESRGSLRIKGAVMRWDTTSPSATVMIIDQNELKFYSADQRLLEIYSMERGLGQIAASPLPRLAVIREHFTIERYEWPSPPTPETGEHLAVKLTPREESLGRHVQEVRVLLDLTTGCASAVRILNPDGDELEISFRNIRTNTGMDDEEVTFDPPAGTSISRPLEQQAATTQSAEEGP
jgi:outer membrane lipoprotein-sorting protein